MHRFFLPPDSIRSGSVFFPEEVARQIARVLRLQAGADVIVLDGQGREYEVVLVTVEPRVVTGSVRAERAAGGESSIQLTLCVGLTQREKFEWVLQKCTEVGVAAFAPFTSARTLVRDPKEVARKLDRWRKIVREAAEQSRRGRAPAVESPCSFLEAVEQAGEYDLALIAWEGEEVSTLRSAVSGLPVDRVVLFIGPEGGFSAEEVAAARAAGVQPVCLGERILRMETAAVVATALILYELE